MTRPVVWDLRSLAVTTGQRPAPDPNADIFSVEFDPCPPDVGELPPAIAAAAAAALDVAGTATTLVGVMQTLIVKDSFRDDRGKEVLLFGLCWWLTVARIRPAWELVHAVGGYLNRGRKPVRMLGATGPSAHHAAIDYARTHTRRMFHLAAVAQKQPNRLLDDPTELCRVSQPANQAIQDTLLAGLPMVRDWYRKNPQPHGSDGLTAAILAEARDAAHVFGRANSGGRPRSDTKARVTARVRELRGASPPMLWAKVRGTVNRQFGTTYTESTLKKYIREEDGG